MTVSRCCAGFTQNNRHAAFGGKPSVTFPWASRRKKLPSTDGGGERIVPFRQEVAHGGCRLWRYPALSAYALFIFSMSALSFWASSAMAVTD